MPRDPESVQDIFISKGFLQEVGAIDYPSQHCLTAYPTCLAAARCVEAWLNYTSQWPALSEVLTHVSYILQSWGRLHTAHTVKLKPEDQEQRLQFLSMPMQWKLWIENRYTLIMDTTGYWIYLPHHFWTNRRANKTNPLFSPIWYIIFNISYHTLLYKCIF